jgi:hypothetical protein
VQLTILVGELVSSEDAYIRRIVNFCSGSELGRAREKRGSQQFMP